MMSSMVDFLRHVDGLRNRAGEERLRRRPSSLRARFQVIETPANPAAPASKSNTGQVIRFYRCGAPSDLFSGFLSM